MNNYHWYLKQQIEFPASLADQVACFVWDPEASLTLHVMTVGKLILQSCFCVVLLIVSISKFNTTAKFCYFIIIIIGGHYYHYSWCWSTAHSEGTCEQNISTVAVIDGGW